MSERALMGLPIFRGSIDQLINQLDYQCFASSFHISDPSCNVDSIACRTSGRIPVSGDSSVWLAGGCQQLFSSEAELT
jgi:hypothetical protein